jgi:hypothetical protein
MGNENTSPATRSAHVDKNRFMYLESPSIKQVSTSYGTYGTFMASARQTPAAPADCMDLSGNNTKFSARTFTGKGLTIKYYLQNPEKYASLAGSFDMAPIIQYAVVCHMESRMPQKMYKKRWPV